METIIGIFLIMVIFIILFVQINSNNKKCLDYNHVIETNKHNENFDNITSCINNQLPLGSWKLSCKNPFYSDGGYILSAECLNNQGTYDQTSIYLNSCATTGCQLNNNNGTLVCANAIQPTTQPTIQPTIQPTTQPTIQSTTQPTTPVTQSTQSNSKGGGVVFSQDSAGNTNYFYGWPNVRIDGRAIMTTRATTETECANNCIDNPQCQLYTYDYSAKNCTLQSLPTNTTGLTAKMYVNYR